MGDIIKEALEAARRILQDGSRDLRPYYASRVHSNAEDQCIAALSAYEEQQKRMAELGADNKVFHGALKYIAAQACSKAEPAESILAVIRANAEFALKREQQALMQAAKGQVFATLNKEDE